MQARAKAAGHAIHPMLVVFPLGLLSTGLLFDLIYLVTSRDNFAIAGGYTVGAGVLGGLAASVFGWVDWYAIPRRTRAKRIGLLHGAGNVVVLALFIAAYLTRVGGVDWKPSGAVMLLEVLGALLTAVTAWLGGELVERLGMGVDRGANLDAPSSLSEETVVPASPAVDLTEPAVVEAAGSPHDQSNAAV